MTHEDLWAFMRELHDKLVAIEEQLEEITQKLENE